MLARPTVKIAAWCAHGVLDTVALRVASIFCLVSAPPINRPAKPMSQRPMIQMTIAPRIFKPTVVSIVVTVCVMAVRLTFIDSASRPLGGKLNKYCEGEELSKLADIRK